MDMLNKYTVGLNGNDDNSNIMHRRVYSVEAADSYLAKCEAYRCFRGLAVADMLFPPLYLNPVAHQVG